MCCSLVSVPTFGVRCDIKLFLPSRIFVIFQSPVRQHWTSYITSDCWIRFTLYVELCEYRVMLDSVFAIVHCECVNIFSVRCIMWYTHRIRMYEEFYRDNNQKSPFRNTDDSQLLYLLSTLTGQTLHVETADDKQWGFNTRRSSAFKA